MQTVSKRQFIIYGVFLVALLAACSALFWFSNSMTFKNEDTRKLPESLDIAFDFYDAWLDEVQANGGKMKTDSILLSSTALENGVRDSLIAKLNGGNDGVDPVLCQSVAPDKIKMKYVSENPTEVELMVISDYATGTPSGFALVKMKVADKTWVITDISCSKGDVLEEREFSFSNKGQLLKNVPAPFDNTQWHLVFSEGGTPGHVAPLRFSAASTCRTNNTDAICDINTLKEAAYAKVDGTMTETGVDVAKMEWSESPF
ncbi:MAG: hypothetical protein ACK4SL_01670 [Candidatus Paceibacteria bacterium]